MENGSCLVDVPPLAAGVGVGFVAFMVAVVLEVTMSIGAILMGGPVREDYEEPFLSLSWKAGFYESWTDDLVSWSVSWRRGQTRSW